MMKFIINLILCLPLVLGASTDQQELRNKINSARVQEKIPLLIQLGTSYTFSSKDSAIRIYHEAINLASRQEDPKLSGDALHQFGFQLYRLGEMDSSMIYLNKSYKYRELQNDSTEMAIVLNLMGNVYWFLDKQITAKEHFEKALSILRRMKNDKEIGRSLNNLANMYRNWGDFQKAIDLYLETSDYYKKANFDEGLAWLNYSITLLYKQIEDYPSALSSIGTALKIYSEMTPANGDSNGIMICYGQLGDIYRLMGDYDKGLKYNIDALRLRQKTGVNTAVADGLMGVGQIYYEIGEYTKAIDYMKRSKELREKSKINSGIVTNLKYLGLINNKLGHRSEALSYLKQGLMMARELNSLTSQEEILKKISHIYSDIGKTALALDYYYQYDTIKDSLNQSKLDKQLSVFKLKTEIKEKQRENERLVLDNKISTLELDQSKALRNILYLTMAFFIFIIFIVIYFYRKKLTDNEILKNKNEEIHSAHQLLEKEIKDRIIIEKQREQLISKLEDSIGKIKTLSGLIPICASCKKIRNDQGYYEQIEKYITQHTDANFTHGICPECTNKLFPGLYKDDKEK